jgi:hypothetical protein
MRSKYPYLSQFAIDILTIPASSCECERLFSEVGELLEPKRRAIGSELPAALQLVRAWVKAGFEAQPTSSFEGDDRNDRSDEDIVRDYNIQQWIT